jgi:hypothetical protein
MSIRESNSRTFLCEAGLDDWFGVIPAVVEFRRFPGEPSEQLRKRPRLHPHPWIIRKHRVALGRLYVHYAATRKSDRTGAREHHLRLTSRSSRPSSSACCRAAAAA